MTVGLFLGWQAVGTVLILTALIGTAGWSTRRCGFVPAVGWLTLATVLQICLWRWIAQLTVSIAGVSVDSWTLEQRISGGAQPKEFNRITRKIASGFAINNGDELRIDGLQGNWDHANVDYVEFVPVP